MTLVRTIVLAAALAAAPAVLAQVAVSDPWVRGTVAGQKATGAFMQLTAAQDARLVSASSPIAGIVEVHEMAMEKDVMKMRKLANGLALPAGKAVELKPGGFHVMLMDLKQQIKAGDAVPMTDWVGPGVAVLSNAGEGGLRTFHKTWYARMTGQDLAAVEKEVGHG